MFEVDWSDYTTERIGQRRARKEAERELKKKEEDIGSSSGTLSTRTSRSSGQQRLSFGSLGRKTLANVFRSEKHETTIPESSARAAESKRGSGGTQKIATELTEKPVSKPSTRLRNTPSKSPRPIATKATAGGMAEGWRESPDQSSKESMLSRMTSMTVSSQASQGGGSITERASPTTTLAQALGEEGRFDTKGAMTAYEHGENNPSASSRSGRQPRTTARPEASRTLRPPPLPFTAPLDSDALVFEAIDEWFAALLGPKRQLPQPDPDGPIRRGNVLLPPNFHRPEPESPTRRVAKKDLAIAPGASRIKFLADNPDDWHPVPGWKDTSSMVTEYSASTDHRLEKLDEEEVVVGSLTADMDAIHVQEGVVKETSVSQKDHDSAANLPADGIGEVAIPPGQPAKRGNAGKFDPSMAISTWI